MNLSRVIGPVIGAALYAGVGISTVFFVNAGTYFFAIGTLLLVKYPHQPVVKSTQGVFRRLSEGFRIARADPLVRRVLITLFTMSLFSLVFVGQMPTVADENFGIDPTRDATVYGALYAVFGLGAALGAVSVGTWFASIAKDRLMRPAMLAFAALLAAFGLARAEWLGFLLAPLLGYAYFVVITSLSTVLQSHIDDDVRGRVMALWIMGFGGTVPIGVLLGGVVADATSITFVLLVGAAVAVGLAFYADLASARSD
jgi:predicted MFS family arabinose efflux permease